MNFKVLILCLKVLSPSNCEQTLYGILEDLPKLPKSSQNLPDFQTVAVAKAQGRIGNHLWLYMMLINMNKLKYWPTIKLNYFDKQQKLVLTFPYLRFKLAWSTQQVVPCI